MAIYYTTPWPDPARRGEIHKNFSVVGDAEGIGCDLSVFRVVWRRRSCTGRPSWRIGVSEHLTADAENAGGCWPFHRRLPHRIMLVWTLFQMRRTTAILGPGPSVRCRRNQGAMSFRTNRALWTGSPTPMAVQPGVMAQTSDLETCRAQSRCRCCRPTWPCGCLGVRVRTGYGRRGRRGPGKTCWPDNSAAFCDRHGCTEFDCFVPLCMPTPRRALT